MYKIIEYEMESGGEGGVRNTTVSVIQKWFSVKFQEAEKRSIIRHDDDE